MKLNINKTNELAVNPNASNMNVAANKLEIIPRMPHTHLLAIMCHEFIFISSYKSVCF